MKVRTRNWIGPVAACAIMWAGGSSAQTSSAQTSSAQTSSAQTEASQPSKAAADEAPAALAAEASRELAAAAELTEHGVSALYQGAFEEAESHFQRAWTLFQRLAPGSSGAAKSLNGLGVVNWKRGDLKAAEEFFRQASRQHQDATPRDIGNSLTNLGIVANDRGDLVSAEHYFQRALSVWEDAEPQGPGTAGCLFNLGYIALQRNDLAAALDFLQRSLEIRQRTAPDSVEHATTLGSLGSVALEQGDFERAENLLEQSLRVEQQLVPQGLRVANSLYALAKLSLRRKDLPTAEQRLQRALQIFDRLAPGNADHSAALLVMGDIAEARGQLDDARSYYQRSLDIRRQRTPESAFEATACQRLAKLERHHGKLDEARASYECVLTALEAQRGKVGGSDEVRSGFGALYANYYREAIDLLVETGDIARAYEVLERSRARELLDLLNLRDLAFAVDLPAELEQRRRIANQRYDRAFQNWMGLDEQTSEPERQQADAALTNARLQQDQIRAEIRTRSPRLDALATPQHLDLRTLRGALDAGTLLLAFSVGAERSLVFAIEPGRREPQVAILATTHEQLMTQVERFRRALDRGRLDPRPQKAQQLARQLSELLLAPVAQEIERAQRLLIVADGPLHSLPFAALADPTALAERRFLVEAKPTHVAASATVFAHLKQNRRTRPRMRLTAFGDPSFRTDSPREPLLEMQVRAATRAGLSLDRLPATRTEVENLREQFPDKSRIYLGSEATESRFKALAGETTHLHIATHGLLDDRFPLDSALVFSLPQTWQEGQDNGLLQAWEIFEQVRIDSDLVTLSACDTGRGKVLGGEGLMGLTRAFQFAGARSVLASLWTVSDRSTTELMKRFYRHLDQGQSKAEALRSAQLELLRSESYPHPFHWAAFQLFGDWR
ncbi:MAG: CHAT domain-containing protein [Acidobacteriota bacterium]